MLTPVLFVVAILIILWKTTRKPEKFPPGLPRWPLIGNLLEVTYRGKVACQVMETFAQKYGEVVGFYMGRQPMILISGLEALREAHSKPEFQGRPTLVMHRVEKIKLGVVQTDGEYWTEQRRFLLRNLRDLGLGRNKMESIIHDGIRDLMEEITRYAGADYATPVPVQKLLATTGTNVIYHMLAGERFDLQDPTLLQLMKVVRKLSSLVDNSGGIATAIPVLMRTLPSLTFYAEYRQCRQELFDFFMEKIEEHKKKLDNDNPSDFIDMFLLEINKSNSHPSFHMNQLFHVLTDMFFAGSDTTSATLEHAFLYMAMYPEIQAKVQKELDDMLGSGRLPSLSDKTKLRYVDATLNEVYRKSSIAPLSIPHSILNEKSDVEFRGYVIPKNSRILMNLSGLHNDKTYWGDPENFRPERFLDSEGNLKREDALLPFGAGKRSCAGESLARNNVFLTFVSLMHNFSIKIPDGDPTPSTEPVAGLVSCTKPFRVTMTPRWAR